MAADSHTASLEELHQALTPEGSAWFHEAEAGLRADPARIAVLLPQVPRRVGRDPFTTGIREIGSAKVNLGAWRTCDGVARALVLLAECSDETLLDLFHHGDMEEKAMILRVVASLPISAATITLLGEAQRTNTANHFEAAVCDSDLLARAVGHHGFELADFNRAILKLAFVDLPLARALDAATHANTQLSRMVQDLATEREAAGRRVWRDTNRLIAHAPTAGTRARIAGGLEHGDDAHRLAAAEGVTRLGDAWLVGLAEERLPREPVEAIRQALRAAIENPQR